LATRYTDKDEQVSVRICGAVPYERDADPDDLPLPSVCFSERAWQSCPHYLRLTQRAEIAAMLGLPVPISAAGKPPASADVAARAAIQVAPPPPGVERRRSDT